MHQLHYHFDSKVGFRNPTHLISSVENAFDYWLPIENNPLTCEGVFL